MVKKETIDNYKEQANIKHNNKYDYSCITELLKRDTKVNIICPIHGIFERLFHKHLLGNVCKKCGIKKRSNEKIKKANDKFVKEYDWNKINKSIKLLQRKFRNSKLH